MADTVLSAHAAAALKEGRLAGWAIRPELDVEEGPEVALRAVLDTPKGRAELA